MNDMPFREKSAWISLVSLLLTFGSFFVAMTSGAIPSEGRRAAEIFFGCVAAFVVLQIFLRIAAAARSPSDARAALDERERLIDLRAARNAGVVLICGLLALPAGMHIGADGPLMAYIAMAVLAASEAVRAASRIIYFRRGF